MMNAPLPDFRSKHWTEPVPPESNRLVANIDPTLEQEIFDLPQRQRIADVRHHREVDNLGRAIELAERITHRRRVRIATPRLKPVWSDTAFRKLRWP